MATIPSKESFFIQANRTNSLIDKDNPDQNASWTTNLGTGDFNLMPGDVVFVDSVSLDILGAEDSSSTISVTGTNAIQNGVEMPYCDNAVLLEVGFTLNNNCAPIGGSNALPLPLKLPPQPVNITEQLIAVNPGDWDSSGNDTKKYSTLGAGLFNADHNTTSLSPKPTNGSLLYEATEKEFSSTTAHGPKFFRSMNVRAGFDNNPYVLLRNDFMGCQGQPYENADELCPALEPQTVFVLLDVNELNTITNVNELAVLLTNKLNRVNTISGDNTQTRRYLQDRSKQTQKGDLIIPYIIQDKVVNGDKAWTNIARKFSSNTMKTVPANLQVGKDYIMYKKNLIIDTDTKEYGDYFNYLHSGTNPTRFPKYWNNILYGNRGVKNIYREWCGDRLKRLDCWRGGYKDYGLPTEVPRLFTRPHLLNTQLPSSQISLIDSATGTAYDVSGTKLLPYQAIFSNVNYTEANFIAMAEAFKMGEGYKGSKTTWDEQKEDYSGWYWAGDVGMADDFQSTPNVLNTANRYVVLDNRAVPTFPPAATGATGIGRIKSRICPCLSIKHYDDETTAVGMGRINIHTRYNPNYKTDTYVFPAEQACKLALVEADLDLTLPEKYNVAAYPYTYYDNSGQTHTLCYFTCFELYDISANILPPSAGFNLNALVANVKLLNVSWGDFWLGTSNSTYDNFAIIPTNSDLLKRPGTIEPHNVCENTNFISVGAANPQLNYTPQNKYAFSNTNTNILMNAFGAVEQVGQQTAVINYWDTSGNGLPNSNDVTYAGVADYKQPNTGIQAEQSGIFVWKVWLPKPNWTPPEDINLGSYWDNSTMTKTAENHAAITNGLTEASETNWGGCLLDKLGFSFEQFSPRYKDTVERYNPETYNNPAYPQQSSNLPIKTDNVVDAAGNPSINILFQNTAGDPGTGTTLFNLGSLNNLSTFVSTNTSLWSAERMPRLSSSGHYNLVTDIVPSNYYNGNGVQSNCVFNIQKSYSSGNFIYGSGSTGIPITEKRTLSTIKIDIYNPDTNKLCRLSPNSCVTFRVERNIEIPLGIKAPKTEDPTERLVKVVNKQEKLINKLVKAVRGVRGERVTDADDDEPEDTEEKQPEEPARKNNANQESGDGEEKRGE